MSGRKRKCTDSPGCSERRGLLSSKVEKLQCTQKWTFKPLLEYDIPKAFSDGY